MAAERSAIPSTLRGVDEAAYADDAGYPAHAELGVRIAQNDRKLVAECRRTQVGYGFPVPSEPRVAMFNGIHFGPFVTVGTPFVETAEWYLRATVELNGEIRFVPYVEGVWDFNGQNQGDARQKQLVDPAAGTIKTYGRDDGSTPDNLVAVDLTVPLRPGPGRSGFVLYSEIKVASPGTGSLADKADDRLVATAVFAGGPFPAAPAPTQRIVRIVNGAAPVGGWRDVLSFEQTSVANDTAMVWPPYRNGVPAGTSYQIRQIYYIDVRAILLRERPLTGNLSVRT